MLDYIKGILISKSPAEAVIEAGGMGYSIHITLPAFESLGKTGDEVKIVTHLYVKEKGRPFETACFLCEFLNFFPDLLYQVRCQTSLRFGIYLPE